MMYVCVELICPEVERAGGLMTPQGPIPSQPQLSHCSSVPQAGKDTLLSVAL